MKKTTFKLMAIAVLATFTFTNVKAQVTKDEVQVIQGMWGMEKRAVINDFMKFTEAEAAKFNPVYDEYSTEGQKLGQERIQILSEYANNYATLTDAKADELMVRVLKNNGEFDKLQTKYYGKMKAAMGAMRAAQFIQLDSYMRTMVLAQIQSNIPFIGELNRKAAK